MKDKIYKLGEPTSKGYQKRRKRFIQKALENRYTYREIGEWFGITRQAVWQYVNRSYPHI